MSSKNLLTVFNEKTLDEKGAIQLANEFPEEKFNLAMPCRVVQYIPPGHKLVMRTVRLNLEDEKKGDFYPTPKQNGRVSPSSQALIKIGGAAAINWFKTHITKERHPETFQVLAVRATVWGQYIDVTGEPKIITDSKSIDRTALEDSGYTRDDIKKRMEFAVERAITGAKGRAIQKEFGIQRSYLPKELARPFVAGALLPEYDMNNPLHVKLLMEKGQRAAEQLYGSTQTKGEEITESTVFKKSDEKAAPQEPAREAVSESKAAGQKAEAAKGPAPARQPKPAPAPQPSQSSGKEPIVEVQAEIITLCKKLNRKPPQPLDEMTESSLRGFLQNLKNQEAAYAKR